MKHRTVRRGAAVALLGVAGLIAAGCSSRSLPSPEMLIVDTAQGPVQGAAEKGVRVFRGIPYAAPPVGALRWAPPEPAASWDGVRAADAFGPACVQALSNEGREPWTVEYMAPAALGMSEDCLTLNVWAPADGSGDPYPVLVYIYGGAFVEGAGSVPVYDGSAFARRGVIVVNMNYRVGEFGFLAHPELTAEQGGSGNYGILDQIAALEWVRDNIAVFGGDPERVTIAGQSAGAMSVYALMSAPAAEGLFARAIAHSGPPAFGPQPLAQAEQAGLDVQDALGAESLAEMRAASAEAIAALPRRFLTPVSDGHTLTADPNAPLVSNVPTMLGGMLDESPPRAPAMDEFRAEITGRLGADADDYFVRYGEDPREALRQEAADRMLLQFADWSARSSAHPRWLYLFSHVEPGSNAARWGAFHSSDLPYVFDTLDRSPDRDFTPLDREIADRTNAYWANFIADGDPNGAGLPIWPAFDTDAPVVLEMGEVAQRRTAPSGEAAQLLRESTPAPGLFSSPPP